MQGFSDYFYLASGLLNFTIILRKQDFTRRRWISSPRDFTTRDFIKKAPFAFCEGGALFFYYLSSQSVPPGFIIPLGSKWCFKAFSISI